jgi:hypothetical protein
MMCMVGGGGPQTLHGYKLVRPDGCVSLSAGVGADLPTSVSTWLRSELQDDFRNIYTHPTAATLRAWQICEDDGRRTQVCIVS